MTSFLRSSVAVPICVNSTGLSMTRVDDLKAPVGYLKIRVCITMAGLVLPACGRRAMRGKWKTSEYVYEAYAVAVGALLLRVSGA